MRSFKYEIIFFYIKTNHLSINFTNIPFYLPIDQKLYYFKDNHLNICGVQNKEEKIQTDQVFFWYFIHFMRFYSFSHEIRFINYQDIRSLHRKKFNLEIQSKIIPKMSIKSILNSFPLLFYCIVNYYTFPYDCIKTWINIIFEP